MPLSTPLESLARLWGKVLNSSVGYKKSKGALTALPEASILGVRFHKVSTEETLQQIDAFIHDGGQYQICIPNVDCVMLAQKDREFFRILNQAHLSVPDGMGVVYASRFLGNALKENVKGRILAIHICRLASERGYSLFLMGGGPGIPAKAAEVLVLERIITPTFDQPLSPGAPSKPISRS